MTSPVLNLMDFLESLPPFQGVSRDRRQHWLNRGKLMRFQLGQPMLRTESLPYQVMFIRSGQARLLGIDPVNLQPITLQTLKTGDALGWSGLVRGVPCEQAIASDETVCWTLSAQLFLELLEQEPTASHYFYRQISPAEVYSILSAEVTRQAKTHQNLRDLMQQASKNARVEYLQARSQPQLDPYYHWYVSGGGAIAEFPIGSQLQDLDSLPKPEGKHPTRLLGLPQSVFQADPAPPDETAPKLNKIPDPWAAENTPTPAIADAPALPPPADVVHPFTQDTQRGTPDYPFVRGKGEIQAPLSSLQMLCEYFEVPFRRDVMQRIFQEQQERQGISLNLCGAIAELVGLKAQLINLPSNTLGRLPTPALTRWRDRWVVIYEVTAQKVTIADPEKGLERMRLTEFTPAWEDPAPVLLLERTNNTPQKKFGLNWFIPELKKYRWILVQVFIASFFVQLFGLVNPLMIQVIIDRVIVQNSADTLQVLGIFLIVVAIVEAILSSLRMYLFVDTTNRIDMSLGSQIIDHLLRLPLRYFEKRPVGELSSRVNELEKIRQFLTSTALTVVLDAVFSVIYIAVMLFYSITLTVVALITIPLFILLTMIVSPIVRRQLRLKAERNAKTQSYLVEVLSGIQTVKAQNIELQSRWKWQEHYARYIDAGFKNVITSTAAGSASNFLSKFSALLVLWVGAYLVLQGDLSLGQLIAFRIISGYVTTPVLRLAQLWQNFQETALSLERLGDIINTPQESDESDRLNIPLPPVEGRLEYENISFRFAASGPMQLTNINCEIEPGSFVAIVGQSGSGKSTLTKLLPRLYQPNGGRILVDRYDISKVELYSLRRQIGIVPQDSLLFEGSVQDNIALTQPEATSDEVIAAAHVAVAHDFIMGLGNGYNSPVGERGSGLSGGQRQRIAIARTVLQNPRLLILDEATSALDYETEREVCLNLQEHFQGRTVLFITHRLSTIRNADVIFMMEDGSIVERGTHDELIELQGRYFCLYQQQAAQV